MFELVKREHSYTAKDGSERKGFNYYLRTENGNYIQVKPAFSSDYTKLSILAKVEK